MVPIRSPPPPKRRKQSQFAGDGNLPPNGYSLNKWWVCGFHVKLESSFPFSAPIFNVLVPKGDNRK